MRDVLLTQTLDVRVAPNPGPKPEIFDIPDWEVDPATELLHITSTACKRLKHLAYGSSFDFWVGEGIETFGAALIT